MNKHLRSTILPSSKHDPCEDDACVLCGGKTGYKRNDPIQQRAYYVEGAGQLCESCYRETYKTDN